MITVEQAKRILNEQVKALPARELALESVVGQVLAEDVFAPIDIPSFDQSSMDGYAVRFGSESFNRFRIAGEIQAGDVSAHTLKENEAFRIFTGAPVPGNADAVVMQEKTQVDSNVVIATEEIRQGSFIRRKGAQTMTGDCAMQKGNVLTPAAIGYLASLGITRVKTHGKPRVSLVITGNEIVQPGNPLQHGQVYESNSWCLRAALEQYGINVIHTATTCDELNVTRTIIAHAMLHSDLVLITGGISVGKYDHVHEALAQSGVDTLFYKIAQKPGKPILAGRSGDKMIFALPGNPASVLVCFYEYVYPSLRRMMGFSAPLSNARKARLLQPVSNNDDRVCFVRAKYSGDGVLPLEGQESYMMQSFAQADCFIVVPPRQNIGKGMLVDCHTIPQTLTGN